MSRVHRRGVVAGAGKASKAYAEWLAYVAASGAVERDWTDAGAFSGGLYKTTATTPAGGIQGSSWGNQFRNIAGTLATSRLIQHACATLDIWNDQVSAGRPSLFQVVTGVTQTGGYLSVNRNGYTSVANASTTNALRITLHRYWYNGQAWTNDPFSATPPVPFTW